MACCILKLNWGDPHSSLRGVGISHACVLAINLIFKETPGVKSAILVFLCCITNYHKFHSLKQHPFVGSQFYRPIVQHNVTEFSVHCGIKLKSRCWPDWILVWRLWGKFTSKFIQVVGRIVARGCETEVSVSYCQLGVVLSSWKCSQIFSSCPSPSLSSNTLDPPCVSSLRDCLFYHCPEKSVCF